MTSGAGSEKCSNGPCDCCGEVEMTRAEEAARAHTLRAVATMIDKKPGEMEWAELAAKLRRMADAMVPQRPAHCEDCHRPLPHTDAERKWCPTWSNADPASGASRACFIDDCREPATYFVHSYPDDVRLCGRHSSLHPVEVGETLCTGPARCQICRSGASR